MVVPTMTIARSFDHGTVNQHHPRVRLAVAFIRCEEGAFSFRCVHPFCSRTPMHAAIFERSAGGDQAQKGRSGQRSIEYASSASFTSGSTVTYAWLAALRLID